MKTIFQRLKKPITRIPFVLLLVIVSLIPASGVARAQIHQSSCYEIWDTVITVSNNLGASRALTIGQGLLATANLDDCDLPAPPMPPATSFEAEIIGTSTYYFTDYRPANQAGPINWRVKYQAGTSGFPITFSWSRDALPGAGTWNLRYFDDSINPPNGGYVDVNMRSVSSAQWTNIDEIPVNITYVTTRCKITAVASGNWDSADTWDENCSGVDIPSTTSDVYIPSGFAVAFNSSVNPTTVESLTVGSGGRLSFSTTNQLVVSDNAFVRRGTLNLGDLGNLAVNGVLTNLGIMQQTKTLSPSTPATFLGIGGYGGLTVTSASGTGVTTVGILGGQICDTDNTSVWRCFTVTPATGVTDGDIYFYYAANEINGSSCGNVRVWRSTGGRNWVEDGTQGATSCGSEPYSVHYTGVTIIGTTGSYFALRSAPPGPTAINLRAFNANNAGNVFPILLIIGFIGLASLGLVAWWAYLKRKDLFVSKR